MRDNIISTKRIKICLIILFILSCVLLITDYAIPRNSPKGVLLKINEYIKNDNWAGIRNCVTPDLFLSLQNLTYNSAVEEYASGKKRKVMETINEDKAYISVFFEGSGEPAVFYFKRKNEKWLMDLPFIGSEGSVRLDEIVPFIEDGDFILSRENQFSSYYIRRLGKKDQRFSHSGIIYKKNGKLKVVCADGEFRKDLNRIGGVIEQNLEDFLENKTAIGIYRMERKDKFRLSDKALEYLGTPFNSYFNSDDESGLYCTQFINVVLRETDMPVRLPLTYVERERKNIYMPESISSSENFKEIIYVEKNN